MGLVLRVPHAELRSRGPGAVVGHHHDVRPDEEHVPVFPAQGADILGQRGVRHGQSGHPGRAHRRAADRARPGRPDHGGMLGWSHVHLADAFLAHLGHFQGEDGLGGALACLPADVHLPEVLELLGAVPVKGAGVAHAGRHHEQHGGPRQGVRQRVGDDADVGQDRASGLLHADAGSPGSPDPGAHPGADGRLRLGQERPAVEGLRVRRPAEEGAH
mmetsp:Transcript_47042/g.142845  ORF Transcript_47042/g.142845 Transcript_47042/m.142845 type:complete len:216 (+) Transcript_47042:378-1025(+)